MDGTYLHSPHCVPLSRLFHAPTPPSPHDDAVGPLGAAAAEHGGVAAGQQQLRTVGRSGGAERRPAAGCSGGAASRQHAAGRSSGGPRRGGAAAPRPGVATLTLVAAVVPALAVEARGDRCGPGRRCGGVGGAAELEAQAGWRCCDGEAAWRCRDGESVSQVRAAGEERIMHAAGRKGLPKLAPDWLSHLAS